MLKRPLGWLSPAGPQARLSVLVFHRVMAQPDPLFPDDMHASRFLEVCGWLKSWFNVLPLDESVRRLQVGTLPARAACITFDDGYADNYQVAMPILQRCGLPATFFIATGFLDGGCMWNDTLVEALRAFTGPELDLSSLALGRYAIGSPLEKRRAIATLIQQIKYRSVAQRIAITGHIAQLARVQPSHGLMMTSQEVKAMRRAGMQIGAHTVSHPILAGLSLEQAQQEIRESKYFLEQLLGERIGLFAYPNGKPGEDYMPQSVDLVRSAGFDAAVNTDWGTSGAGDDVFQIRRFTPWDRTRLRFGARMLRNLHGV